MVNYDVDGFCDRNKDILYPDLIEMIQGSKNNFMKKLFAEDKVTKIYYIYLTSLKTG